MSATYSPIEVYCSKVSFAEFETLILTKKGWSFKKTDLIEKGDICQYGELKYLSSNDSYTFYLKFCENGSGSRLYLNGVYSETSSSIGYSKSDSIVKNFFGDWEDNFVKNSLLKKCE